MPTALRLLGFRFFSYSEEGNEPPQVHVERDEGRGRVWISPLRVAYVKGFTKQEAKRAEQIIRDHRELTNQTWNDYLK